MIITKNEPFSQEEITHLREKFDTYIKTVIDIKKNICSAGCDRHFESEKILLDHGSLQNNLWGGGIDIETLDIDCNYFINIRPNQQNTSNEIQDPTIRKKFNDLTKIFFKCYMEDNKTLLAALAMDLKRLALSLHRHSDIAANRFMQEVITRNRMIKQENLRPYLRTILKQIGKLNRQNNNRKAEDALMLSTRIQNYVLRYEVQNKIIT